MEETGLEIAELHVWVRFNPAGSGHVRIHTDLDADDCFLLGVAVVCPSLETLITVSK